MVKENSYMQLSKNYKKGKNIMIVTGKVSILEENVLQETEENSSQQLLATLKFKVNIKFMGEEIKKTSNLKNSTN